MTASASIQIPKVKANARTNANTALVNLAARQKRVENDDLRPDDNRDDDGARTVVAMLKANAYEFLIGDRTAIPRPVRGQCCLGDRHVALRSERRRSGSLHAAPGQARKERQPTSKKTLSETFTATTTAASAASADLRARPRASRPGRTPAAGPARMGCGTKTRVGRL